MCVCVCVTFYPNSTHIERERQRERERERGGAPLFCPPVFFAALSFLPLNHHSYTCCFCPCHWSLQLSYLHHLIIILIPPQLCRHPCQSPPRRERERERERELVQYFSPNNSFIGLKPKVALQVWRVTLMP